ncbi:MAG: VCBS repeat-containing protein [Acidobacteria bacterium]|nr:VCBS repeat-containing protein [Acidobacteriota bacterium]
MLSGRPTTVSGSIAANQATARDGARVDFLTSMPLGAPVGADDRPLVAHVSVADLDKDGLTDIIVADAANNQVTWLRQSPAGTFTESVIASVAGPAHVVAVDVDADGDSDLAVASLGVLFPNNAPIGAVIVLENDGRQSFMPRVLISEVPRVADVRAGDLDGDGDVDLSVALFGYDQGETRWLENRGGWRFESHLLQQLSGVINAEIVDADTDGDLDIVTLVSQEWEEIYVFANDGRGGFTPTRVFGASNEDFGSSWISIADLDADGDADVVYSNGDAFDYAPPTGRGWNGLQWLENRGGLRFVYHRIGDFSGASSPQAADLDGDGDLDIAVVSAYNRWERPEAMSLVWFENDGAMSFTRRPIASAPTHLITLATGDLNGDGHADLITGGMHMSPPFDRMSRVTAWINHWPGTRP